MQGQVRQQLTRHIVRLSSAAVLVLVFMAGLTGCSIHEEKSDGEKKVDIKTPIADLKVRTDVEAKETGLPVYPGAWRKPADDDEDENAAHVNLSGFGFGLKVVAVQYQSDDPPDKVVAFYKDKLKEYGSVLECTAANRNRDKDKDSDELSCDKGGSDDVELKVGTKSNQRIVAIKPRSGGSEFALVHVQTRGRETI